MGKFTALLAMALILPLMTSCSSHKKEQQNSQTRAQPHIFSNLRATYKNLGAPVYIQIFKQERQLELYTRDGNDYKLLKTFPICQYSGGLGPKQTQGDNKSPEGFYSVGIGQLNPNSHYYKALNIGYPNEYDQSHGYDGKYLMIHGDCVSIGCYAMTDRGIDEIYLYVESALRNGQGLVYVNIFPFRMTDKNMALHRNSSYMYFWQQLQPGYQYFVEHHRPPFVMVNAGRYIVNSYSRQLFPGN